MGKIKVSCKIKTYENDENNYLEEIIAIKSHPNYSNFVVLEIDELKKVVSGEDLIKAINNCVNTGY